MRLVEAGFAGRCTNRVRARVPFPKVSCGGCGTPRWRSLTPPVREIVFGTFVRAPAFVHFESVEAATRATSDPARLFGVHVNVRRGGCGVTCAPARPWLADGCTRGRLPASVLFHVCCVVGVDDSFAFPACAPWRAGCACVCVQGHACRTEQAGDKCTLFIGRLPKHMTPEGLRRVLQNVLEPAGIKVRAPSAA